MDKTIVCAAFCGTGKSYLSKTYPKAVAELECWYYREGNFPQNYVEAVKNQLGKSEFLFISTDPVILKQLRKENIEFILAYPDNSLKEEYMQRFCNRNDAYDFIGVMYKHWDEWLNKPKKQKCSKRIVLKRGEFLENVISK